MDAESPTETGLVIPVPPLEAFVRAWRPRVDPVLPPTGLPAHITVLYPSLPPPVAPADVERLRRLFAGTPKFSYRLTHVDWFGDRVCFIAVDPPDPFVRLTEALTDLTGLAPYEGEHPHPIPHLTIANGGTPEGMRDVATAASALLPLDATADQVWLMEGTPDPPAWRVSNLFSLETRPGPC